MSYPVPRSDAEVLGCVRHIFRDPDKALKVSGFLRDEDLPAHHHAPVVTSGRMIERLREYELALLDSIGLQAARMRAFDPESTEGHLIEGETVATLEALRDLRRYFPELRS